MGSRSGVRTARLVPVTRDDGCNSASMAGVNIRWDRDADAAYISLVPADECGYGVSHDSVTLEGLAKETGIDALHSLVLDFDREGKLIGIEVLTPRATLRDSTLRAAD
jgi:uncharacterized protein YuzE